MARLLRRGRGRRGRGARALDQPHGDELGGRRRRRPGGRAAGRAATRPIWAGCWDSTVSGGSMNSKAGMSSDTSTETSRRHAAARRPRTRAQHAEHGAVGAGHDRGRRRSRRRAAAPWPRPRTPSSTGPPRSAISRPSSAPAARSAAADSRPGRIAGGAPTSAMRRCPRPCRYVGHGAHAAAVVDERGGGGEARPAARGRWRPSARAGAPGPRASPARSRPPAAGACRRRAARPAGARARRRARRGPRSWSSSTE